MNSPDTAQTTHTGLVREHNEDCVKTVPEQGLYIVAVSFSAAERAKAALVSRSASSSDLPS